jgi:hypothetical protein
MSAMSFRPAWRNLSLPTATITSRGNPTPVILTKEESLLDGSASQNQRNAPFASRCGGRSFLCQVDPVGWQRDSDMSALTKRFLHTGRNDPCARWLLAADC